MSAPFEKGTFPGVVRLISRVGKTFSLPKVNGAKRKNSIVVKLRERERKEPMKKDTHTHTGGTKKVDDHDGFSKDIERFSFSSSSRYAHTHTLFIGYIYIYLKKKKKKNVHKLFPV